MPTKQEIITQYLSAKTNPTLTLIAELKKFEIEKQQVLQEIKEQATAIAEKKIKQMLVSLESKLEKSIETSLDEKVKESIFKGISTIKGDKGDTVKGDDGYTPKKGVDYFTEQEINAIIKEIQGKIKIPENGITPIKGVDYPNEKQIRKIINSYISEIPQPVDGKTPMRGVDYFTSQDIENIVNKVKEQIKIPEQIEITAKEIRDKLQSLSQFERLDASAIKGLDRYIKKETQTNIVKMGGGRFGGGGMSMNGWVVNELVGTGDNSTTEFTLDYLPYDASKVELWVGNAKQFQGDEYTISGKTITFLVVPPTDYKIWASYYKA